MNPTFEQIMPVIFRVARREMLLRFRKDCCIASTRVIVKILRRYGIDADAMAVRAFVFSPGYVAAVEAGKNPPPPEAGREAMLAWFDENKAWGVGLSVDPQDPNPKWPGKSGHLVAVVPALNTLIDASIDQANRPQYGINLPPVFTGTTTPQFFMGKDEAYFGVNGCALCYEPFLNDQTFRESPDWIIKDRTRPVIRAITFAIERELLNADEKRRADQPHPKEAGNDRQA